MEVGSRKPRLLLSKKWREAREAQAYAECKATASFLWELRERWMHFWRHIGHRPVDVAVLTSPACSSTATCQQTRQRGVRSVSESQVVKLCAVEVRTKSRYVPVLRTTSLAMHMPCRRQRPVLKHGPRTLALVQVRRSQTCVHNEGDSNSTCLSTRADVPLAYTFAVNLYLRNSPTDEWRPSGPSQGHGRRCQTCSRGSETLKPKLHH